MGVDKLQDCSHINESKKFELALEAWVHAPVLVGPLLLSGDLDFYLNPEIGVSKEINLLLNLHIGRKHKSGNLVKCVY